MPRSRPSLPVSGWPKAEALKVHRKTEGGAKERVRLPLLHSRGKNILKGNKAEKQGALLPPLVEGTQRHEATATVCPVQVPSGYTPRKKHAPVMALTLTKP